MDEITRIQGYFARKAQAQPDYRFRFRECSSLALPVNADGKPCAGKLARTVWEAA
jgi:hypothetical protein